MNILLKNGLVVTQNSNGEIRIASLIQKPCSSINITPANMIFNMTTLGGVKALGLPNQIGNIIVGTKVDLTILDLNKVHCIPADDIYSQIVSSANASNVQQVMIDGKWTVYDSNLITITEDQLLSTIRSKIQNQLN